MIPLLILLALVGDDEAIRQLRDKGVKATATSAEVGDCSKWTDDDFKLLAKLTKLK